ncbi:packaging ATPase [Klosneuvirus KNV1]|uniref:Packaging ATPase n=1 Tax=Klosneuvirus KNV1 TaxID=1977640 RepID=A0A1V0SHH1_9VIRU|nr:packaging ATPase [Klosneuvirus KNV1]
MYAIVEIKEEDHSKKIVAFVDTHEQFIIHVKNLIGDDYTTLEKLSYQDFSKSKTFKQGRYLLINDAIVLLEKKEILREGFIYNTVSRYINIIKTWELYEMSCDFPQQLNTITTISQTDSNTVFIPTKQIINEPIQLTELKSEQPSQQDINKLIDEVLSDPGTYDEYDAIHTYERLNASDIEDHSAILIIGKRGSGKTTIVNNILSKYDETFLANSLIISPTEKINSYYKNKYPYTHIETEYQPEYIEHYLNTGSGAIVLDNCFKPNGYWKNDLYLMELLHHAKYYNKLLIITSSFPLGFDSDSRSAFDYVFLLSEEFFSNQKRIYDHYAGVYETFDLFRNDFINLTKHYNSMVINQNSNKNNNDQISWFNAVYNYSNVFKVKLD